jgi:hypothetical protein
MVKTQLVHPIVYIASLEARIQWLMRKIDVGWLESIEAVFGQA